MKKLTFLAFGFLLGLVLITAPAKAMFSDVSSRSQYGPSIFHLQDEGIVQGFVDGSYRPSANITRAEYTKILLLSKFESTQVLTCDTASFPDVEQGSWYFPYICYAKTNKIVSGYGDGTFHPNEPISYAEGAKILVNVLIANTASAPPPQWWTPFTALLASQGVQPPTVDSPTASLSRGEMAYMASGVIRNTAATFIQQRFDGKLVYVTNPGTSVNDLKVHCSVEGGEFDECGSPCEPGAEICADVCAYTCTMTAADTDDDTTDRTTFILERFGSKLVYNQDDEVTSDQLKLHCATEGGLYNSCGNACAPDATDCDDACVATCEDIPEPDEVDDEDEDEITIEDTFPNKLVYTTKADEPVEPFRAHCAALGGEFDECGSPCAPDAEVCAQVCAYTCTNVEDSEAPDKTTSYESGALGFRLEHPTGAIVVENTDSPNGDSVDIRLAGATQAATGALTDGIMFLISLGDLGTSTLSDFVDARIDEEREDYPITKPKERYTFAEKEGFRFESENGSFIYLPGLEGTAYVISSFVKDPDAKGYQPILDQMLVSLEFIEQETFTFTAGALTLKYPADMFEVDSATDSLTLTHEVPFQHADACDFQGTGTELSTLTDFSASFTTGLQNLEAAVTANESADFATQNLTADKKGLTPQEGFIEAIDINGLKGFKVTQGVEGCGEYHYYLPIGDDLMFSIERKFVPEFSESYAQRQQALEVEGAILPEREEAIFDGILHSWEPSSE